MLMVSASTPCEGAEEFCEAATSATSKIVGKDEARMMVCLNPPVHASKGGKTAPCAFARLCKKGC